MANFTIDKILCIKHTRKTDNAVTFSFKSSCFQILDNGFPIISARREINALTNPRFSIRVEYKGQTYRTIRYLKPQKHFPAKTLSTLLFISQYPPNH